VTSGIEGEYSVLISEPFRCVLPLASVPGKSVEEYDILSGTAKIEYRQVNDTTLSGQP
jgi:hypothetical protein